MSCIHPVQVDAINITFSPTAGEIDYCQKVLQAFEEANARGDGSIAFGGQLIDRPIVARARRTIDTAKSLGYDPRDCLKSSQGDSIVIPGTPDHSPG